MRWTSLSAAGAVALLVSACSAAEAAAPLTRTPDGRALEVTFADEFDSFRPYRNGQGVWRTTFRDGRDDHDDDFNLRTLKWNKELQLYVDPEMRGHRGRHGDGDRDAREQALGLNPFRVKDGVLEITADRVPAQLADRLGGFGYTSGLITTQPSHSQTYGYFEMRAKLPRGKGVWPAFWLLPLDLSWPPEIDVMESVGDPGKVYVTLHSNAVKAEGTEIPVSPGDFHTYAVAWTRENVVWFVDGREVKRMATPADMHKPMYMLANIALGGDWAGAPDATTPFPARLQIDFIRAYRFAP
ncbi:glycoside hydrolase family 16 protein [Phenylobacterium sp.]|jgi:beta-glucanase (GH16 family)|uniref:glycoside hydrolase family 16 protein n=1 Tax=Phenylobacterium sp. TaxID=1871053 RepID=UPI003784AD54